MHPGVNIVPLPLNSWDHKVMDYGMEMLSGKHGKIMAVELFISIGIARSCDQEFHAEPTARFRMELAPQERSGLWIRRVCLRT